MQFKTGTYVKSKLRTKEFPLIVLAIDDDNPSEYMFNGVIIHGDTENEVGSITNSWNTNNFEICPPYDIINAFDINKYK